MPDGNVNRKAKGPTVAGGSTSERDNELMAITMASQTAQTRPAPHTSGQSRLSPPTRTRGCNDLPSAIPRTDANPDGQPKLRKPSDAALAMMTADQFKSALAKWPDLLASRSKAFVSELRLQNTY